MNYSKTFQLKYNKLAKITITLKAESYTKFENNLIFKSNLKYEDIKNMSQPIKGMIKLKIQIDNWLLSIDANKIKSIEFRGSLFLGYYVVKDLLLKNIEIQELKCANLKKLSRSTNYIFLKYEEFVEAAIDNSFSIFPTTISTCKSCHTPSKSFKIEKNSKLSVVIPTKNETSETLDSLLFLISNEISKTDEIIIVDDNVQTIEAFESLSQKYPNLKLIRGNCLGVANARNSGLNQATGDLISFVDSDDYISENFFKIQKFIHSTHPVISATGTWLKAFGEHSRVYQQWDNFNPLCMRMCLPPAGVLMWKKEALSILNGFNSNFDEGFEDFELISRANLNNLLIVVVDSIEYYYQRGQESLSQSWNSQKEIDLRNQVVLNSKKLCDHKYLEFIEIEEEFSKKLNYASIDQIFTKISTIPPFLLKLKKYRNSRLINSVWEKLPSFFKRFIFYLVTR
jgi:glycosyltransferase involved in cell wall biosynthesis